VAPAATKSNPSGSNRWPSGRRSGGYGRARGLQGEDLILRQNLELLGVAVAALGADLILRPNVVAGAGGPFLNHRAAIADGPRLTHAEFPPL
jgi:hypothetical protein